MPAEATVFERAGGAESGHVTGKSSSPGSGRKRAALFACVLLILSLPANAADLKPETQAAFHRYVQLTEAQSDSADSRGEPFLWIDRQTPQQRAAMYAELRAGNAAIERLETFEENGKPVSVPSGLVHQWIGTAFIPGATLAETLDFEKDYDHQAQNFQPHVQRSRILNHSGEDYEVLLRFREKKVITVVLDTVHEVHYETRDATHALSRSYTSRIQQVDHPGEADESLEPAGQDDGFLWAMNTDWRFEEKDGGTFVECRTISLTRDIPAGLGWLVAPFVTSIPRESLAFTLGTTRTALLRRIANHAN
ncbi:MAG TPA: hypothetical protein VIC00_05880 [Candidatus Acidoferrales bacterium]